MSLEENKAALRRYYDGALNGRNLNVIDEVFATSVISHGKEVIDGNDTGPYVNGTWGAEDEKKLRTKHLDAFPDATIDYDLIAEGDIVASRWSVTFTKKSRDKGTIHYFYRFEGGKIVEMWYMW